MPYSFDLYAAWKDASNALNARMDVARTRTRSAYITMLNATLQQQFLISAAREGSTFAESSRWKPGDIFNYTIVSPDGSEEKSSSVEYGGAYHDALRGMYAKNKLQATQAWQKEWGASRALQREWEDLVAKYDRDQSAAEASSTTDEERRASAREVERARASLAAFKATVAALKAAVDLALAHPAEAPRSLPDPVAAAMAVANAPQPAAAAAQVVAVATQEVAAAKDLTPVKPPWLLIGLGAAALGAFLLLRKK